MSQTEAATANGTKTLPDGWRWMCLGEVCQINPRRQNGLNFPADRPTTFVPMSAIDGRSGRIAQLEVRPFADVQRGYTYFEEGDVLFAKITPCMQNGKHAIARNLEGGLGFGTTEFHVLRPGQDITSEWIHYFLRQPTLLEAATEYFTGTVGQQRLPPAYLADLPIPLPPRQEQERIVATLTERLTAIERARAATEAQLEAAKALPAVYLRAIFNSPQAQGWPRKRFDEVSVLQRGYDLPIQDRVAGPHPIMTSSGFGGTHSEFRARGPGVVTGRSGSVGKVHFVERDYWPHNTVLYVKDFLGNEPRYIFYLLQWVNVRQVSSGTGVPTLDRKQVYKLIVPHPYVGEQKRIATQLSEQMASAEQLRRTLAEQLDAINALPAALLCRAFRGGL